MNNSIIPSIRDQGFLPLYFHRKEEVSIGILKALYAAGIRIVEYTNRGPEALRNFAAMKKEVDSSLPGMMLALGTVLDAPTARTAVHLGADFLISPGFVEEIGVYARENQVLWIPGCMTPTDIIRARAAGIQLVKLFPGSLLGPEFMRSVRELFPDMLFMPTGGVKPSRENLSAWFGAGVCAVGMGSTLISAMVMESRDYPAITGLVKEITALIAEARKNLT